MRFDRPSVKFALKSLPTFNHMDCCLLKISCIIMQNRVHIMHSLEHYCVFKFVKYFVKLVHSGTLLM